MKITARLARFSAYSHAEDHLRVKTVHGGIVSLLGATIAILLFFSELSRCLSTTIEQRMDVDNELKSEITIHFDITFPALPCRAIRVDTGDVSGKYETEAMMADAKDGEVHKWQIDSKGKRLHKAEFVGPRGYDNPFILALDGEDLQESLDALTRHEGCHIQGWLAVHKVAGNLHFAVRPEVMMAVTEDPHVLDSLVQRHLEINGELAHNGQTALNASHIINTLRFGPAFQGQAQPLAGVQRIDRQATGIDKYYIKIVPTVYYPFWGRPVHSYQYSTTEYYTAIPSGAKMLPGIFFLYDTYPIRVSMRKTRLGILHALVRVSAVCGGMWAVTGVVDRMVHWIVVMVQRGSMVGGGMMMKSAVA